MRRRPNTTIDDVLEMFRANLVEVDRIEETALSMRNVLGLTTFALIFASALNILIAVIVTA